MVKTNLSIRRKEQNNAYHNLPVKVTNIETGNYECKITDIYPCKTRYGNRIVIKLECITTPKLQFDKYFENEQGVVIGSELYQLLESMNVVTKTGRVEWQKIIGKSVTASIEPGKNGKPYVTGLIPTYDSGDSFEPTEDSAEYEEDEYEEDDDDDMEDEEEEDDDEEE